MLQLKITLSSFKFTYLSVCLCVPLAECAHLLLAHNAPVKVKNAQGWSPLAEAISYGDRQMSKYPWLDCLTRLCNTRRQSQHHGYVVTLFFEPTYLLKTLRRQSGFSLGLLSEKFRSTDANQQMPLQILPRCCLRARRWRWPAFFVPLSGGTFLKALWLLSPNERQFIRCFFTSHRPIMLKPPVPPKVWLWNVHNFFRISIFITNIHIRYHSAPCLHN